MSPLLSLAQSILGRPLAPLQGRAHINLLGRVTHKVFMLVDRLVKPSAPVPYRLGDQHVTTKGGAAPCGTAPSPRR